MLYINELLRFFHNSFVSSVSRAREAMDHHAEIDADNLHREQVLISTVVFTFLSRVDC